jgi:hypothetical protein
MYSASNEMRAACMIQCETHGLVVLKKHIPVLPVSEPEKPGSRCFGLKNQTNSASSIIRFAFTVL